MSDDRKLHSRRDAKHPRSLAFSDTTLA